MPSTTIEAMEGYASIFDGASQRADEAAFKIHQVINSDAQTDVITEAGPVPSHAKQARLYLESIPDAVADISGQMSNGRIYNSFAEAYPETGLNQHFWVSPAGSGLARVALFKKTGPATQDFVYSYASGTEVEVLSGVEDRSLVGLRIGDALNTFSLSSEPGEIANRPPLSLPIVPSLGGSSASIPAPSEIARRGMTALSAGSKFRVKIYTGRIGTTALNGTYRSGVYWYSGSKQRHATPRTVFTTKPDITDFLTFTETFTFGGAGSGADIEAPAGAAYGIPFFGVDGTTGRYLGAQLDVEADLGLDSIRQQANFADAPTSLFADGSTGVMFDFTSAAALGSGRVGAVISSVPSVLGNMTAGATLVAQKASVGLANGRLGMFSPSHDTAVVTSGNVIPATGPFTLIFSHKVDISGRQDAFWQHAAGVPGRVQMGANARFNGAIQVPVDGMFQVYIDGITGGSGAAGQPKAAVHPIGSPGVFMLVCKPGEQQSEFWRNGELVDRFTAPPVVADLGKSQFFGITAGNGQGQTFGRVLSIGRALERSEINLAADWVARSMGLELGRTVSSPYSPATIQATAGISVYVPPFNEPRLTGSDVLYEKGADTSLLPASLTKTLSSLVMLDVVPNLGATFTFQASDETEGSGNNLEAGDVLTFRDALHNMMLPSSNETATAVARVVGQMLLTAEGATGDPQLRFVQAMNAKAAQIGMTGSHFMNPSGLHNSLMHTTARDIARLGVAALGYPAMLDAWGKPNYLMNVAGPNARPFTIISSITMLTNGDSDVLGGKTGTLGGFGYNLLLYTSAPNGNRLVSVVIQAPTDAARYSDMRALLESIRVGHQWPLLFPMAMK